MGKKRKSNGIDLDHGSDLRAEQTNYNKDEEFLDSEDEFYAGRDQILLDDGPLNKRRKVNEDDEFLQRSDEEVLGYDDDRSSSADSDVEDEGFDEDGNDYASDPAKDEEDADNLQDWGASKADYYNADLIETEADALEEEKEAQRLQQKLVQNLTDADFGFDEHQWVQEHAASDKLGSGAFTEQLPELEVREDASPEEKTQILRNRYPEFEPLAKEFVALQKIHEDLSLAADAAEAVVKLEGPGRNSKMGAAEVNTSVYKTPIATCKLRALSAYLGMIGMYFALLTSAKNSASAEALAMAPADLRDHPIVQSLHQTRQLWEGLKAVPLPELQDVATEVEVDSLIDTGPSIQANGSNTPVATNREEPSRPTQRLTKAGRGRKKAQKLAETERLERINKAEAKLADLDALISIQNTEKKARPSSSAVNGAEDSDFGDEEKLTAQEAADKAQRKKSLRFYTSQIAQKSNKRGAASRDAGGDADLPYKERLKDRQARLVREAEQRGRSQAGDDERLDIESIADADQTRLAEEMRESDVDTNGYYDLVSARSQQKRDVRKALAEAQARAAQVGGQVQLEEQVGPDGKRAITYAIAKNKGLAPRRKKEVRNPRVKKKMRYEQKMKKLGSIRPVYKGGEGRGGYGGELTGIKTNVLKGMKL